MTSRRGQKQARKGEPMAYLLAHLTAMPTECTTWPYDTVRGYAYWFYEGRSQAVHIAVCTWHHGSRPKGMQVCHSCHNGHLGCFTPAHLYWGTPADDGRDRTAAGRMAGEQSSQAKLTNALVAEIRDRYAAGGVSQYQLAREYGISQPNVSMIVGGKTWTR